MKGQISIEYLSTFGWILLVVMVTILAISQFGVLDLANELPEECYFGEQLICNNQYLDENGNLLLTLQSQFNKKITIENIEITDFYVDIAKCNRLSLNPGEEANIICPISESATEPGILFEEDRKRFDVHMTIRAEGINQKIELDGIIIANVLAEEIGDKFSCAGNGGSYICDKEYECDPDGLVNIEGFIGTGFCCNTECVSNYCRDAVDRVPAGLGGICCTPSRSNPVGGLGDIWADEVCKITNSNSLLVCANTCDGGSSSGPVGTD